MQKILKKIHDVMQEVKYIQKDAKNKFHGYSYASELAIKATMGEAFRKHGIVFQLETLDQQIVDMGKDKNNISVLMTVVKCKYTFHDVDSMECMSGDFVSSGPARDDKGLWAATTNAIKYILTSTFLIPTGDDAESDNNHPPESKDKKKTTKKAEPKTKPIKPRDAFSKRLTALCGEHKLVRSKKKAASDYFLNMLCNAGGLAEIANKNKWSLPEIEMINDKDHTGWLVLVEKITELGSGIDMFVNMSNEQDKKK